MPVHCYKTKIQVKTSVRNLRTTCKDTFFLCLRPLCARIIFLGIYYQYISNKNKMCVLGMVPKKGIDLQSAHFGVMCLERV